MDTLWWIIIVYVSIWIIKRGLSVLTVDDCTQVYYILIYESQLLNCFCIKNHVFNHLHFILLSIYHKIVYKINLNNLFLYPNEEFTIHLSQHWKYMKFYKVKPSTSSVYFISLEIHGVPVKKTCKTILNLYICIGMYSIRLTMVATY